MTTKTKYLLLFFFALTQYMAYGQFTFHYPTGTSTLSPGQQVTISWSRYVDPVQYTSLYLFKGSQQMTPITQYNTAYNNGQTHNHVWTVPNNLTPGSDYKVQLGVHYNGILSTWSQTFSIIQDISDWVDSPNGNEFHTLGSNLSILLDSAVHTTTKKKVELYDGSTMVRDQVFNTSSNSLSFNTSGLSSGKNYKVKVIDDNNSAYQDWSDAAFSMANQGVEFTNVPASSSQWTYGDAIHMDWTNNLTSFSSVAIHLLYYGQFYTTLYVDSSPPDTESFSWTIPTSIPLQSNYSLRVSTRDLHGNWHDDYSPWFHLIEPDLDQWIDDSLIPSYLRIGDQLDVAIDASVYSPDNVTIELLKDGVIILGPETGTVSNRFFQTTGLDPGEYTLRIFDTNITNFEDESIPFYLVEDENFVKSVMLTTSGITDPNTVETLSLNQKREEIQFLDGLGRIKQVVQPGHSPSDLDHVQPVVYDALGRSAKNYLPVTSNHLPGWYKESIMDESGYNNNFYNDPGTPVVVDSRPFGETVYERSLLHRVLEKSAPGEAWQTATDDPTTAINEFEESKTVKLSYDNNASNEVALFKVDNDNLVLEGNYSANQLTKMITSDEETNQTIEFKDKRGQTILKRVEASRETDTQNIVLNYDDFSMAITGSGIADIVVDPVNGGGAVNLSIQNNQLSVSFSGTFQATALVTGHFKYINSSPQLPDLTLGSLDQGDYVISIVNGHLHIQGSAQITGFNTTFNVNLNQHPQLVTTITREWADTYYVYDDFGNLRYVLPPEGVEEINTLATSLPYAAGADPLDRWAFQYKYDGRKRMIEKKVPGAEPVKMIYDDRDRLVLTQDGEQRKSSKWLFTKYDQLNRPVITGEKIIATPEANLRDLLDGPDWLQNYDAYESLNGSLFGYTSNSLPKNITTDELLTVTYYDNYTFPHASAYPFVPELGNTAVFDRVKGQVTGTKIKILDGSNTWLDGVTYYDNRYRVIQSQTETLLGGVDRVTNRYDFIGQV
ncbi:MAG: DUF6443 domain-containing protein, partial [Bacteroidota bacterium]